MANPNPRECQLATKGTAMSNGTAFPRWYITFQTAVLQQLPRPDVIDQVTGLGWADNQEGLQRALASALCPPVRQATASAETQAKPVAYLKRLFEGEKIILEPTDGTRVISHENESAKSVFAAGIDENFVNWHLDGPSPPTRESECVVFERTNNDASLAQIFGSVGCPLEQLKWTPHQIIQFCERHHDKLDQDWNGTFFLLRGGDKSFVAEAFMLSPGHLSLRAYSLSGDSTPLAEGRHRFVFPKPATLVA